MHTASLAARTTTGRGAGEHHLESVAATWPIGVKIAAAAVLIGAFGAQIVNRSLLDMSNGYTSYFTEISAHPTAVNVSAIVGIFAPALLVGSVLVWFRITRERSRIAAWVSLISGVLAFTCLPLLMGFSVSALALAQADLATSAAASALDGYDGLPAAVVFGVYNNASMLTIFAAAWALWHAHSVSRLSVVLLVLFMIGDIAGVLPFDAHYLALAATMLMAASFFTARAPFRRGETVASIEP